MYYCIITLQNETEYRHLTVTPVSRPNCSECVCMETAVFSVLPSAAWNYSHIRCATYNGSSPIDVSLSEELLLSKGRTYTECFKEMLINTLSTFIKK